MDDNGDNAMHERKHLDNKRSTLSLNIWQILSKFQNRDIRQAIVVHVSAQKVHVYQYSDFI